MCVSVVATSTPAGDHHGPSAVHPAPSTHPGPACGEGYWTRLHGSRQSQGGRLCGEVLP